MGYSTPWTSGYGSTKTNRVLVCGDSGRRGNRPISPCPTQPEVCGVLPTEWHEEQALSWSNLGSDNTLHSIVKSAVTYAETVSSIRTSHLQSIIFEFFVVVGDFYIVVHL